MLSKKKSEPQGPLFFCSLGYEHTVIVTGDSHIVTGTGTWV